MSVSVLIYIPYIYFTFWLFSWYSAKMLRDVKGIDQYWHIPQAIFLAAVYLLPFLVSLNWSFLIIMLLLGMQYPFIFNSLLNLHRKLPINHLGRYDFINFKETVIMFALSLFGLIMYVFFYH